MMSGPVFFAEAFFTCAFAVDTVTAVTARPIATTRPNDLKRELFISMLLSR
jgi:hypothetical protein